MTKYPLPFTLQLRIIITFLQFLHQYNFDFEKQKQKAKFQDVNFSVIITKKYIKNIYISTIMAEIKIA